MRDLGTYSQKRKAALRRRNIVCILCALVTLGAGWVLMRPAITLSDQPECGLEAHTHTEECYTQQIGPAPLVCTLEEHAHNDDCYDAEGNLLCQTQEHIHSEGCYGEPVSYPVLTCTIPEHTHTDDCCPIPEPTPAYTLAPELCCGMAEHTHGEGCYDGEDLICTIPEHIHTDICLVQQEPQQTEAAEQEPLTPLEELRQRLGIETEEDAAALDELLQAYGLTPEEILAGLAEMEADPEAEKIDSLEALQALLEAASAVETLETEDGTLVPKTGGGYTGTVTVGDLTVTVDTTTWTTGMGGYRLQVTASDTEPVKMDHGRVVVDKGIKVEILTADGMPYTCGELTFTVDAASPMTESENPKIYHHVDGALAEWDSWQKVKLSEDKKTLTTGNQITAPAEFLIDHWEPLTETYLDWPGASYSIGYILRKYNVFVQNDYTGSHVVGPVVAGGTVTLNGLGGLSYGSPYGAPHSAPSYIGTTKVNTIITAQPDLPVYLGKEMYPTGIGVNDGVDGGRDTGNYWYAEKYVDFAAAKAQILSEMQGISGTMAELGTDDKGKTLPAGGCYEFPAGTFGRGQDLDLLNVTAGQDTTIILRGETVNIPKVWLDGKQPDSIESGQQSGIVFLCPDAATVNGTAVTGHIVAPNAHVDLDGGYFNGCVIAKSLKAAAEGHMWAYSGQRMPMTTNNLQAIKLLNGKQITDQTLPNTTFTFDLYEKNGEGGWSETPVQSVNNALSEVNFKEIIYQSPGEYLYKIQERNESATHPGIMFDSTVYYAKVTVTASGGSLLAKATYYSDEACQDQLPNAYSVTFNNRYGGKLPDTGGPGMTVYILPGVFLMALALAGACISRKRRAA